MSNKKISELMNAEEINDSDVLPMVQGNFTKKILWSTLINTIKNKFNPYNLKMGSNAIALNADLNNLTTPGTYRSDSGTVSASLANCPHTSTAFKMIVESTNLDSRYRQTIYANNADSTTYVRTYSTSGWGNWQKVATNLSSGVITLDSNLNIIYNRVEKVVNVNINFRENGTKDLAAYGTTLLATLPAGFRPTKEIDAPIFAKLSNESMTTECYLIIYPSGAINVYNWGTAKTVKAIIGNISFLTD